MMLPELTRSVDLFQCCRQRATKVVTGTAVRKDVLHNLVARCLTLSHWNCRESWWSRCQDARCFCRRLRWKVSERPPVATVLHKPPIHRAVVGDRGGKLIASLEPTWWSIFKRFDATAQSPGPALESETSLQKWWTPTSSRSPYVELSRT